MRLFQGFLIMLITAVFWMLPVSQGMYDFRTDAREQTVVNVTGPGVTTSDNVLARPLYDDDYSKVILYSDNSTDSPLARNYDSATRLLTISGLSESNTRTITITYPIDALSLHPAVAMFMSWVPMFWYLIIIVFPVTALIALFTGRL